MRFEEVYSDWQDKRLDQVSHKRQQPRTRRTVLQAHDAPAPYEDTAE